MDGVSSLASTALSTVQLASSRMRDDTAGALQQFVGHMDTHGDVARDSAIAHFAAAASEQLQQTETLHRLESSSSQYQTSVHAERLQPRGTTPRKSVYPALPTFSGTRDHQLIMAEYRSALQPAASVSLKQIVVTEDTSFLDHSESRSPSQSSVVSTSSHSETVTAQEENVNPQLVPELAPVVSSEPLKERTSRSSSRASSRLRPPSARNNC